MSRLEEIRDFLALTERIGTAGQPLPEQFTAVREAGYEGVINLIPPMVPAGFWPGEPEAVAALGMEFVNIPVEWQAPTSQDLMRFFEVMAERGEQRLFIHCVANKRVSVFLFLYRVLCLGMEEADAEDDLDRIWTPAGVWRAFLEEALTTGRAELMAHVRNRGGYGYSEQE